MKLKYRLTGNSVLRKNFLSYIVVCMIPIFIIAIIFSIISSDILLNQSKDFFSNETEDKKNVIDFKIKQIYNLSVQLNQTPWIQKIMNMYPTIRFDEYEWTDFKDMYSELANLRELNNDIVDIGVYFTNSKIIIHSMGRDSIDDYFDYVIIDNNSSIKERIGKYNNLTLIHNKKISYYKMNSDVMVLLQSIPPTDPDAKSTLIVILNRNAINSAVVDINKYGVNTLLADENGTIIAGNADEAIIKYIKHDMKDIQNGCIKQRINEADYFIFYAKSTIKPWLCVTFVPINSVVKEVIKLRNIILCIAIISLSVGVLESLLFAKINYEPVKKIIARLRKFYSQEESFKNSRNDVSEYEYIDSVIDNLILTKEDLEKERRERIPILREVYLNKLIHGLTPNDDGNIFRMLDMGFKYSNYMIIAYSIDIPGGNARKEHYPEYIKVITNKTIEQTIDLSKNSFIVFNETDECTIILLNTAYNLDYINNFFIPLIKDIKKGIEKKHKVLLSAGIGNIHGKLDGIKKSYDEAVRALNYRMVLGNGHIISYAEICAYRKDFYYYPIKKETQLINSLKIGEYQVIERILEEIMEINTVERKLSVDMARCLFYDIQATLIKATKEIGGVFLKYIDQEELAKLKSIRDMCNYTKAIYRDICMAFVEKMSTKIKSFKKKLLDYVDKNYDNYDLGLSLLAFEFGCSESYISKFFKEHIGINYYDYINQKRIEKAKSLILNTDETIQKISSIVGYGHDKIFRRVFKKYVYMCPVSYRKMNIGKDTSI